MDDFVIRTREDLVRAVEAYGFLPLFRNPVPGFSVEEHASPEVWYSEGDSRWDVWEWKGPVIREIGCAYGKFFGKKAAFVSREWFPDLANYRRDGYDFDARWDDGLAPYADKDLYELKGIRLDLTRQSYIDRAHRRNIAVQYWTINDADEMRLLIEKGVDAIMTDDPQLLKKVLEEYR